MPMPDKKHMVKKAILPVAGLGTRMLPATKAIPKEMLPIIDKPLVQLVVDEAIAAGIEEIVLVTRTGKESIRNHLDQNFTFELACEKPLSTRPFEAVKKTYPKDVVIVEVRQEQAQGLGHAILCARPVIGDEPFAILLPDVLVKGGRSLSDLAGMIHRFEETGQSQILVEPVAYDQVDLYGIVKISHGQDHQMTPTQISAVVEKPARHDAPSNLAIVGRYVLSATIWQLLAKVVPDRRNEIQLTTAIEKLVAQESVHAYSLQGSSFDCGSKLGYTLAFLDYALHHPEFGDQVRNYLQEKNEVGFPSHVP